MTPSWEEMVAELRERERRQEEAIEHAEEEVNAAWARYLQHRWALWAKFLASDPEAARLNAALDADDSSDELRRDGLDDLLDTKWQKRWRADKELVRLTREHKKAERAYNAAVCAASDDDNDGEEAE